jgi:hypothetical protein
MYTALNDHLTSTENFTAVALLAVERIGCLGLLAGLLAHHAPRERAAAIGFNTFMLFVGAAIVPLAIGHFPYHSSMAILAIALLVAAGAIAAGVQRSAVSSFSGAGR